jgi:hypothetical protein
MNGDLYPFSIVIVILVIALGVLGGMAIAKHKKEADPSIPKWSITSDLTTESSVTTNILVDPKGQKFLIVRRGGIAIIPYKEVEQTAIKPEKE